MTFALRLAEKHDGELGSMLSVRVWLRLLSCAMVIEKRLRRGFETQFGTTLPRFDVLAALDASPEGLQLSALSRRLLVSNGNVTGLVQALKAEGLVETAPVPGDRRAQMVKLTDTGRARFADLAEAHHGWIEAMLSDLSAADRERLHALLGRVKASIARNPGVEA
ncbi:MAG: MarR family transcriptional regulator [Sphingomonadaceae bacterium]|nr:MarR family transcriptional regulator [Sphingomonadaceae bacterium]